MGPAKASHPAAAGDALSVGGAELICVVPHTRTGGSAAMQGQRVADGFRPRSSPSAGSAGRKERDAYRVEDSEVTHICAGGYADGGGMAAGGRDAPARRPAGAHAQGHGRAGGRYGADHRRREADLTLLDGSAHAFGVSGLNVQGHVGSSIDLEAKGEVYNLQRLGDFAGTYRRAIGVVDPERPTNTLILENEHGVRIVVTVTVAIEQTDVRILPSESGVTVKLRE
jgi:hypothetical protein